MATLLHPKGSVVCGELPYYFAQEASNRNRSYCCNFCTKQIGSIHTLVGIAKDVNSNNISRKNIIAKYKLHRCAAPTCDAIYCGEECRQCDKPRHHLSCVGGRENRLMKQFAVCSLKTNDATYQHAANVVTQLIAQAQKMFINNTGSNSDWLSSLQDILLSFEQQFPPSLNNVFSGVEVSSKNGIQDDNGGDSRKRQRDTEVQEHCFDTWTLLVTSLLYEKGIFNENNYRHTATEANNIHVVEADEVDNEWAKVVACDKNRFKSSVLSLSRWKSVLGSVHAHLNHFFVMDAPPPISSLSVLQDIEKSEIDYVNSTKPTDTTVTKSFTSLTTLAVQLPHMHIPLVSSTTNATTTSDRGFDQQNLSSKKQIYDLLCTAIPATNEAHRLLQLTPITRSRSVDHVTLSAATKNTCLSLPLTDPVCSHTKPPSSTPGEDTKGCAEDVTAVLDIFSDDDTDSLLERRITQLSQLANNSASNPFRDMCYVACGLICSLGSGCGGDRLSYSQIDKHPLPAGGIRHSCLPNVQLEFTRNNSTHTIQLDGPSMSQTENFLCPLSVQYTALYDLYSGDALTLNYFSLYDSESFEDSNIVNSSSKTSVKSHDLRYAGGSEGAGSFVLRNSRWTSHAQLRQKNSAFPCASVPCARCLLEEKWSRGESVEYCDSTLLVNQVTTSLFQCHLQLAYLYMQEHMFPQAIEALHKLLILKSVPSGGVTVMGDAYHALGASLLESGYWEQAQLIWNIGLKCFPTHAKLLEEVVKNRSYKQFRLWRCRSYRDTSSAKCEHNREAEIPRVQDKNEIKNTSVCQWDKLPVHIICVNDDPVVVMSGKPVLSTEECKDAIVMAEEHAAASVDDGEWGEEAVPPGKKRARGWTTTRHYAVPTTDLPVHQIPKLLSWFNDVLAEHIYPLFKEHFAGKGKNCSVYVHDAFIVKYSVSGAGDISTGQRFLPMHMDQSSHSFVLPLNNSSEYVGGGTYFQDIDRVVRQEVGNVCAFKGGSLMHGGEPITRGVRYIIAAFLYVRTFDGLLSHSMTHTDMRDGSHVEDGSEGGPGLAPLPPVVSSLHDLVKSSFREDSEVQRLLAYKTADVSNDAMTGSSSGTQASVSGSMSLHNIFASRSATDLSSAPPNANGTDNPGQGAFSFGFLSSDGNGSAKKNSNDPGQAKDPQFSFSFDVEN